VYVLKIRHRAI